MSNSPYADILKFIREDNLNKLIIAQLDINSIRKKFDFLVDKIKGNVDIMMISETKLKSVHQGHVPSPLNAPVTF